MTDNTNFKRLMQKLQPVEGPENLVLDPYGQKDIAEEVSSASSKLSPEDVAKILNAESSGGQNLRNPASSAKGNFQFIDSTRKQELERLKNDENVEIPANPDRRDAMLMKSSISDIENALQNSKTGPKEPNLENIYTAHHYGKQGALNMLNDPNSPLSRARRKHIQAQLAKKPLTTIDDTQPTTNLLDLLKD